MFGCWARGSKSFAIVLSACTLDLAQSLAMPKSSDKTQCQLTDNEGESSHDEEESPAHVGMRGMAGLVTASCPREYPRSLEDRRKLNKMIPADFDKSTFLENFQRLICTSTNRSLLKAYCVDEPHKRFRKSTNTRERHKHIAFLIDAPVAHKKLADEFQKRYGIRISFSFRLPGFQSNSEYLREPGKKPSTDIDSKPAVYPNNLDVSKELEKQSSNHLLPAGKQSKQGKKRKTLSFVEVSNIVLEGVGDGPIKSAEDLQKVAKRLKYKGDVELWNYIGGLKGPADVGRLVTKVWHLNGEVRHEMFRQRSRFSLDDFSLKELTEVTEWIETKSESHTLVLSGDGGLGKTHLAEALLSSKCPAGYWFLDDPEDFK